MNRHLHLPLLVLCSFESSLSLLQVKICVIFTSELSDLDEEISEVILESWDVLIQVEQSCDRYLDLIVHHVTDSLVGDVKGGSHFFRFDQCEHVGEDCSVHGETGSVRCVRHYTEHVLQNVCVVRLVETLSCFRMGRDILQHMFSVVTDTSHTAG